MKQLRQNLFLVLISSVVALLIGEGAVRLIVPKDRWQFRDASSDWAPDSLLGWKQKVNYKTINYDLGVDPVVFETNIDGFRPITSVPEHIDTSDFVIFLVGNSTVNSRHVPEPNTIHYHLDSLLTLRGKNAVIVNASVQGYSTDQALLMIKYYAAQYKPDWIVYGFCDNDLGGIMNQVAYSMNKPKFENNEDTIRYFPLAQPNLNFDGYRDRSWKDLIVKSALYRMIKPMIITMRAKSADPATQILVGANSVDYYFAPEKLDSFDWKLLRGLLIAMDDESKKAGAKFAFYSHPALESVWIPHIRASEEKYGRKIDPFVLEGRLGKIAGEEGIIFIPLAEYFRSNQARGPFHLLPKDTHCNGTGYLLQAEVIVPVLLGEAPANRLTRMDED